MTLNDRLEELKLKINEIELECDLKIQELEDQIYELEQIKCEECEGFGYMNDGVCPYCSGDGESYNSYLEE